MLWQFPYGQGCGSFDHAGTFSPMVSSEGSAGMRQLKRLGCKAIRDDHDEKFQLTGLIMHLAPLPNCSSFRCRLRQKPDIDAAATSSGYPARNSQLPTELFYALNLRTKLHIYAGLNSNPLNRSSIRSSQQFKDLEALLYPPPIWPPPPVPKERNTILPMRNIKLEKGHLPGCGDSRWLARAPRPAGSSLPRWPSP